MVVVMLFLVGVLYMFLIWFKWGKVMWVMFDNFNLVLLFGIDNCKVVVLIWIIVGGLCVGFGFFFGFNMEFKFMMGWYMLLLMFVVVIFGGVGCVEGVVFGGLIVGIVEELFVLVILSEYKVVMVFVILLFMLFVCLIGLFKGKVF